MLICSLVMCWIFYDRKVAGDGRKVYIICSLVWYEMFLSGNVASEGRKVCMSKSSIRKFLNGNVAGDERKAYNHRVFLS